MNMTKAYEDQMAEIRKMNSQLEKMNENIEKIADILEIMHINFNTKVIESIIETGNINDEKYILEVLEMARKDIDDVLNNKQLPYKFFGSIQYSYWPDCRDNVEFIVNKEKRVVVCLYRVNGFVARKGIARCHPNDTFYEEIGKVIALYRMFGLIVPEEYIQ